MQGIPYFMTNPEWFYHDEKEFRYKLTTKATDEAKKSYKEFYEKLDEFVEIDGEIYQILN